VLQPAQISPVAMPSGQSQLVIMKPGTAPFVDRGYAIKTQARNVDVSSLANVDRTYYAPGASLGNSQYGIRVAGNTLRYQVISNERGVEIKPLSADASRYVEQNQAAVVKAGVARAAQTLSVNPGNIKTIYINFN
jgi:hypothetical protein